MAIILKDSKGTIIHQVEFSNDSENLPKVVKELSKKIEGEINEKFGAPMDKSAIE